MPGLSGEFYTVLYMLMQQVLSATRVSGESTFHGLIYISRIGRIMGASKVSA